MPTLNPAGNRSLSLFWKIVDALEPEPRQAQVIIGLGRKIGDTSLDLEAILKAGLGGPRGGTEAVLVLAGGARACQDTVYRLGQLGISQLHALYPPEDRSPGLDPGTGKDEG